VLRAVRAKAAGWPAEIEHVRHWYEPLLERQYEDAVMRQSDLAQLVQIASTYSTRERFLTELTLDPPDAMSDKAGTPLLDEDYLILSTIHSARSCGSANPWACRPRRVIAHAAPACHVPPLEPM
jgi:DNA helicase-2/ATP-dependent DNA helicase PcrA